MCGEWGLTGERLVQFLFRFLDTIIDAFVINLQSLSLSVVWSMLCRLRRVLLSLLSSLGQENVYLAASLTIIF